jgi:hypothetical protein
MNLTRGNPYVKEDGDTGKYLNGIVRRNEITCGILLKKDLRQKLLNIL